MIGLTTDMSKAKIKELSVTELFKQFCKERHAEDKGRNYDTLQEIYARTELFDLSLLPKVAPNTLPFENGNLKNEQELIFENDCFKNITLPFESQFVKVGTAGEDTQVVVFLREYAIFTITGTTYIKGHGFTLNVPFKMNTETGKLFTDLKGIYLYAHTMRKLGMNENRVSQVVEATLELSLGHIIYTIQTICNLPKHSVATDTPKHAEYYTRKHSSTLKVIKPIYYVLDKKEEKEPVQFKRIKPLGHCCFDHSFKVRSHWRRINKDSLGVDRFGIRRIKGMTFIKEYIKGEGDLIKKIRILK